VRSSTSTSRWANSPIRGKRNSKCGANHSNSKRIPGPAQIAEDVLEIRRAEMREQPAVVNVGAPAHQAVPVRLAPEPADQSAQEQVLREAHARMRRHLEGPHLDQAQAAAAALRREQLIDAELRPVGVAAGIDEQVAEEAIHQPGRDPARGRVRRLAPAEADLPIELAEGDLEFVKRIVPGFIDPRRLRGGADEQTAEEASSTTGDSANKPTASAANRAGVTPVNPGASPRPE